MSTYEELNELIELIEESNFIQQEIWNLWNIANAAVQSYITLNGMQRNLIQEAFLIHFSAIFDIPSYFYSLPFLIVGTRSTRTFSDLQYWRITHPFLADDNNPRTSFRAMYRMNLTSFERLVSDLSQHPVFDLRAHNSIPVYIQISCAIWRLANCHLGYRIFHMGFGVSHGSYMNFFRRTLIAIEGVYGNLISWPVDQERVQAIKTGFEWPPSPTHTSTHRLPNVIGALDGKNVVIESPRVHAEHWRDRKGNFAMKLTAVSDDKCRFTYIRVGDSGRTHDAAAFKWTEIFTVFLRHPQTFFSSDGYILADSAYPLSNNIIVPYPTTETNGNSPEAIAKRRFNKVHSSARMSIERAFGLLSSRWRFISKHVYVIDIKDICLVITAACILHNFCINIDDPGFPFEQRDLELNEEDENEDRTWDPVRTRRDELNRWFSSQ